MAVTPFSGASFSVTWETFNKLLNALLNAFKKLLNVERFVERSVERFICYKIKRLSINVQLFNKNIS